MSAATLSPPRAPIVRQRVSTRPRRGVVCRAVSALRLKHPELRRPITLEGLLAVLARERIGYKVRNGSSSLGWLLDLQPYGFGDTCIVFTSDRLAGAALLSVIAHELGHRVLHSRCPDISEPYQAEARANSYWFERDGKWFMHMNDGPMWKMVEDEADLFSDLVLGPELATIARQQIDTLDLSA